MFFNLYLRRIIKKYRLPILLNPEERKAVCDLKQIIADWADGYLCEVKPSGSRAKGTAILGSDLDLFISLSSSFPKDLREIYNSLYNFLKNNKITARKQNVSIGIIYNDLKIDLVPAKRQGQFGNDHSLYKYKTNSWTKTNINTHISIVRHSGRINEIIALKVWKKLYNLKFPSIYLESFVIDSLYCKNQDDLGNNFIYLLKDIKDNITTKQIVDPANSNNVLSNDLSFVEKLAISYQAHNCLLNIKKSPILGDLL